MLVCGEDDVNEFDCSSCGFQVVYFDLYLYFLHLAHSCRLMSRGSKVEVVTILGLLVNSNYIV
jgi:hypothetical protein